MPEVIDIAVEREKRQGPDAEHVWVDPATGTTWFRFSASFRDGEQSFCISLWAMDWADAERRIGLIRESLELDGQVFSEIDA